jgi:integration host factor subunit alpha
MSVADRQLGNSNNSNTRINMLLNTEYEDSLYSMLKYKPDLQSYTRRDLIEAVYQEVGLSRKECESLLETVLDEISDCLAKGDPFKVANFASFSIRQKNERIGRNPKTGEEVPIPPRKVVVFRAASNLKKQANSRNE